MGAKTSSLSIGASSRASSIRVFIGAMGLAIGWGVATVASVGGLYASFKLDVPTGAAIVCTLGLVLLVTGISFRLRLAAKP